MTFSYEDDVPSLNFNLKKREMLVLHPVSTANSYMDSIDANITATHEMLDFFISELNRNAVISSKANGMREGDDLTISNSTKKQLQSKIESDAVRTESYTKVMDQINKSHNVISSAVSGMADTMKTLFENNSATFLRLNKIGEDTSNVYKKILQALDLLEISFLKKFEAYARQANADMEALIETVSAYYHLNTIIRNKYAWNDKDIKDTLSVGKIEVEAYYSQLVREQMQTKDSFIDFVSAFTSSRGKNFQRFIDTSRPWKLTDSIGVTIIGFLSGAGLGYYRTKKWRYEQW